MVASEFPHLAAYLAKLPAGLGSYPECRTKGILIRSSVKEVAFHPSWEALPPPILEVMRHPPLPTAWVSTVLTNAVHFAVADTYHPTAEAMLDWNYKRTMRVSTSPMYRMLTRVAGLKNFLRGAVKVHALFQQSTDMSVDFTGDTSARVVLEHPPFLHVGYALLANEAVFTATLESAGATTAKVKMVEASPERAVYDVSWTS